MTDYGAIIVHYFGRPVARTKELSSGQIHCAFADGTMAIYSKEQIEKWAEDILNSVLHDENMKKAMSQMDQDIEMFGCGAIHVPSFEIVDPMSDTMRQILLNYNYLIH